MGTYDDYVACMDDWMYSPAPGETFTSMLDNIVAETNAVTDSENISGHLFQGPQGQGAFGYPDGIYPSSLNTVADENTNQQLFEGPQGQGALGYPDGMNPALLNTMAHENVTGNLFQGPQGQGTFAYPDGMNPSVLNTLADETINGNPFQGPQGQGAFLYPDGINPSVLKTVVDETTNGNLFQGPQGHGAFDYPDGVNPSAVNTVAGENINGHLFQGPQGEGAIGYFDGMNPNSLNTLAVENISGGLLQGSQGQGAFVYPNGMNASSLNTVAHENMNANTLVESTNPNHGGFKERAVARSGFDANALRINTVSTNPQDYSQNQGMMSSCWTTPPDLVSPSVFLDTPELITNPLAMPSSPTVGKFTPAPDGNNQNSTLPVDNSDKGKENIYPDFNASSFRFNDANPSSYFGAATGVNSNSGFAPESCTCPNVSDIPFPPQGIDNSNIYAQTNTSLQQADGSNPQDMNGGQYLSSQQTQNASGGTEFSPPMNPQEEDVVDRSRKEPKPIDDGYTWRKYGQKQVKGSEFPRSYFKCTQADCPARKKIQHAAEGFGEATHKGSHNHPKPPPIRSPAPAEVQLENHEASHIGSDGDIAWSSIKLDNVDAMSSIAQGKKGSSIFLSQKGSKYGYMGRFVNGKDDDRLTNRDVRVEIPGAGPKKRKTEMYTPDMGASRTMKEPRVVVQTKSEVDVIDDGYRWRKYGQKLVKGNPNPRSYYKCTDNNCNVRKHVERASTDLSSVITTYEGKHNHQTPAARSINRFCPGHSGSLPVQQAPSNLNSSQPSQLGSFGLPGSGFGFSNRINRRGVAPALGIAGLPGIPSQPSTSLRQ